MALKLKLNVKNVILGCNNFSDILARNNYRFLTGITSSSGPRAIAPNKPDCYFSKQNYVKASTLNQVEAASPRKLENTFLNRASPEESVTGKWLDEVRNFLFGFGQNKIQEMRAERLFGSRPSFSPPILDDLKDIF